MQQSAEERSTKSPAVVMVEVSGVCRLPAPTLLTRWSLQGCLQIYTNAMSKLFNCNIKQPAESVTSTMRPVIFMEVLTFQVMVCVC